MDMNTLADINTQAWPWSKEQVMRFLKSKHITPTLQRVQIAEMIFAKQQHISADQLMQELKRQQIQISKATVYNTLSLFTDKKVVQTVTLDPERVLYDSNVDTHYHVYDANNGFLMDIPKQEVVISRIPNLPQGIELQSVDVVFRVTARPEILRQNRPAPIVNHYETSSAPIANETSIAAPNHLQAVNSPTSHESLTN